MNGFESSQLESLASIFYGNENKPSAVTASVSFNPGQIGAPKPKLPLKPFAKNSNDIWDQADEVEEIDYDPRPAPDYDIIYRQKVSSEDMYLGTGKTPSFGHSDELVCTVQLESGTSFKNIELICTETTIELLTPTQRLKLVLPNCVNDKAGDAKWDASSMQMIISLPIVPAFPI